MALSASQVTTGEENQASAATVAAARPQVKGAVP
jgi:hypothetical protein